MDGGLRDVVLRLGRQRPSRPVCAHLDQIRDVTARSSGCEECVAIGDTWVHLRLCLTCGHVGCCDNSKNRHASKHYRATQHPIIRSLERSENWRWCYIDDKMV